MEFFHKPVHYLRQTRTTPGLYAWNLAPASWATSPREAAQQPLWGQSVNLSGKLLRPCLEKSSPRPMGQSRGYSLGEEAHVTNPDLLLNLAACLIGAAYLDVSRLWSTSVIAFQFRPKYPRVVRDMNWSNVDPARPCQTGQCCCILAQASQLFVLQWLTRKLFLSIHFPSNQSTQLDDQWVTSSTRLRIYSMPLQFKEMEDKETLESDERGWPVRFLS